VTITQHLLTVRVGK